jgi:plastocyanin
MSRIAAIVVACSLLLGASTAGAADQTVRAVGFTFVAPVVVAGPDDRVFLESVDAVSAPHTFTTTDMLCRSSNGTQIVCDTGDVLPGAPRSVRLRAEPGVYEFFCKIHRSLGMVGQLVVQE